MNDILKPTQDIVSSDLEETYQTLKKLSSLPDTRLSNAMEYALFNGGKRIRPLLHRLVATAISADVKDARVCEFALECIHAYSLVHDDLPAMDNDELRRGKPTLHIAFDEATAILAGDALQSLAYECLALLPVSHHTHAQKAQLIGILACASGARGMCLGQNMDLEATNKTIDADALIKLHQLKTGALLKASVEMATALIPDVTSTAKQLFLDFADAIGLAFQIQDDILDVTSDTTTLGKPQGSDQSLNKSTFVTFYGLEGARQELQKKHKSAMRSLRLLDYNTSKLEAFTNLIVSRSF